MIYVNVNFPKADSVEFEKKYFDVLQIVNKQLKPGNELVSSQLTR